MVEYEWRDAPLSPLRLPPERGERRVRQYGSRLPQERGEKISLPPLAREGRGWGAREGCAAGTAASALPQKHGATWSLLPPSRFLAAACLVLFFAALSPALAGQSINTNTDVDHDIYGNGNQSDGDAPTSNDPTTLTNSPNDNTVNINRPVNFDSCSGSCSSVIDGDVAGGAFIFNGVGDGTATHNSVTVNSDVVVLGSIFGGVVWADASGAATGNSVTINNGGTADSDVYGGVVISGSGNATASGNSVTINSGGTAGSTVWGGMAVSAVNSTGSGSGTATASGNIVNINGGTVGAVWGGAANSMGMAASVTGGSLGIIPTMTLTGSGSGNATASGNIVNISGGTTVGGDVYGGVAESGSGTATASNNSVIISGGTVNGNVYGGVAASSSGNATASGNSVIISGGTVNGSVSGGVAGINPASATATNQGSSVTISGGTVTGDVIGAPLTIKGNPTFGANTGLYGNTVFGLTSADPRSGNALNLYTPITVASAQNFENWNFYLPSTMANGGAMLTVTGTADLGANATVNVGINGAGSPLQKGDTVTLIDAATLTGNPANNASNGVAAGMQGVTLLYDFDISQQGNQLLATVASSPSLNPQAKSVSQTSTVSVSMVNSAGTVASTEGVSQAVQATSTPGSGPKPAVGGIIRVIDSSSSARPFGSISAGHMNYDTGSSVGVNSVSLIAGLARANESALGRLTMGGFFEGGHGSYNAYSSFSNMASVHGDGNINNIGAGVLGRLDFGQFGEGISAGRFYTDASARVGRVKSDFTSSDLRDLAGTAASFDSESWYYGLHVGGGYLLGVSDTSQADFYVRYLWSHQNGDDVRLSTGDQINFDAVDSHRTVVGARYTWVAKSWLVPYVGAAWEHEFDGKAGSSVHGMEIASPSLSGDSGMGEVGVNMGSNEGRFAFDLGVQGYLGVKEGISGTFRVVYRW